METWLRASGAMLIVLAVDDLLKQKLACCHLVCCSSDNAFRSAVTLSSALDKDLVVVNFNYGCPVNRLIARLIRTSS